MTNSEYRSPCANVDEMVLENGSPNLVRRQIMYSILDLARASALVQYPKESGVYKLGIERCATAIDFLKNVLDRYAETLSPDELVRIKYVVFVHEQTDRYLSV